MHPRARRWAHAKMASFTPTWGYDGGPLQSDFGDYPRMAQVSGLMQSHVPTEYAKKQIAQSTGLSFQDRARLYGAVNAAAKADGPHDNLVQMKDLLPAVVGAGVGLVGAALTAPIFTNTPLQKRLYGIGAGALGAVLNTYGRG